jgi:hypothetical protein
MHDRKKKKRIHLRNELIFLFGDGVITRKKQKMTETALLCIRHDAKLLSFFFFSGGSSITKQNK